MSFHWLETAADSGLYTALPSTAPQQLQAPAPAAGSTLSPLLLVIAALLLWELLA